MKLTKEEAAQLGYYIRWLDDMGYSTQEIIRKIENEIERFKLCHQFSFHFLDPSSVPADIMEKINEMR